MELRTQIRGALARGYCHQGNTHKILDADLIEAMTEEVVTMIESRIDTNIQMQDTVDGFLLRTLT